MGWANKIIGWATGNGAEVDAGNNLKTTSPQVNQRLGGDTAAPNYVGAVKMFTENDAGSVTGVPHLCSPMVSENRRLKVGNDTLLWHGMFPGTAQNTGVWKHLFTTMTATQAGDGFLLLNANLTGTTATGCSIQTWRYFSFHDLCTLQPTFQFSITNGQPVANQVWECGLFVPTATAAPADGAYIRYSTAGLYGYIKFGAGAEVASPQLVAPNGLALNTTYDVTFLVDERAVEIWIGGVYYGEIVIPAGNSNLYQNLSLPIAAQQRNAGAVSGTQMQVKVSCTSVYQNDISMNKPWSEQMAGIGNAYQGLDGGTMGSLAIYSNAALAAAAALANATAAAGNTGLGGVVLVLPTLTAGADGILFSYLNPVGSTTQPARTLYVRGIRIDASVQVVLAGGPLTLILGAAFGHNAVSLATAESASFANNTAKAPRRVPLGNLDFVVTAAAGTGAVGIYIPFASPLVVNPGEYFAITMRNMGTVTTTGALALTACVDHYFE